MADDLTPEQLRDIDYGLQKVRFACLVLVCMAWGCGAVLLIVGVELAVALFVGGGVSALSLLIWLVTAKVLRTELTPFADPATGELVMPSGRSVLKARETFVELYLSTKQDRFLWSGLLAAVILLLLGFLVAR